MNDKLWKYWYNKSNSICFYCTDSEWKKKKTSYILIQLISFPEYIHRNMKKLLVVLSFHFFLLNLIVLNSRKNISREHTRWKRKKMILKTSLNKKIFLFDRIKRLIICIDEFHFSSSKQYEDLILLSLRVKNKKSVMSLLDDTKMSRSFDNNWNPLKLNF